jgi:hypothetical protein
MDDPPKMTNVLPSAPVTVLLVATPDDSVGIAHAFHGERDDDDRIGQRRQGGAGAGRREGRSDRGAELERVLPKMTPASSLSIIF